MPTEQPWYGHQQHAALQIGGYVGTIWGQKGPEKSHIAQGKPEIYQIEDDPQFSDKHQLGFRQNRRI